MRKSACPINHTLDFIQNQKKLRKYLIIIKNWWENVKILSVHDKWGQMYLF